MRIFSWIELKDHSLKPNFKILNQQKVPTLLVLMNVMSKFQQQK